MVISMQWLESAIAFDVIPRDRAKALALHVRFKVIWRSAKKDGGASKNHESVNQTGTDGQTKHREVPFVLCMRRLRSY